MRRIHRIQLMLFIMSLLFGSGVVLAQDQGTAEIGIPPDMIDPTEVVNQKIETLKETLGLDQKQADTVRDVFNKTVGKEREIRKEWERLSTDREEQVGEILNDEQKKTLKSSGGLPGLLGQHDARMFGWSRGRKQGKQGPSPMGKVSKESGISLEQQAEVGRLIIEEDLTASQAVDKVLDKEQKAHLKEMRKAKRVDSKEKRTAGKDDSNEAGTQGDKKDSKPKQEKVNKKSEKQNKGKSKKN
ncbi:MAG: hypothetical protein ABIH23_09220 [bacterium]